MSKPNLPPLPPVPPEKRRYSGYGHSVNDGQDEDALRAWATAYAEEAVRQALAAQVAKINAAMASMCMDGVNGGAVQKEYFKAGARRAIQAVNSALRPEASDQET